MDLADALQSDSGENHNQLLITTIAFKLRNFVLKESAAAATTNNHSM